MSKEPLDHKTRKMIYNLIIAQPGITYNLIKSTFDLADGTLRYHLNFLERNDKIKSKLEQRNKCYYPIERFGFKTRPEPSEVRTYKLSEKQEMIIGTIRRNPRITQKDLILKTRLLKITLAYNLKKLLDLGIIRKQRGGRNIHYYIITVEQLKEEIILRLATKLLKNEIDEQTFLKVKRKLEEEEN
jgi:predicted transcriptional regulator